MCFLLWLNIYAITLGRYALHIQEHFGIRLLLTSFANSKPC